MIEDEIEALTDQLRGRRCRVDDGHGGQWHGRFVGSTGNGPCVTLLFAHPDPARETMVQPLRLNRETVLGAAFEPPSGPAGRRTVARLSVHLRDGGAISITEDDTTRGPRAPQRPRRSSPPATTIDGHGSSRMTDQSGLVDGGELFADGGDPNGNPYDRYGPEYGDDELAAADARVAEFEQQGANMALEREAERLVDQYPELADEGAAYELVTDARRLAEHLGDPL